MNPAPSLFAVAILAFEAKTTRMFVIVLMARIAIGLDFDLVGVLLVTGITFHLDMAASQRKVRILIVIKFQFFPAVCVMAFFAIRAIAALVDIVQLMTGVTLHRGFHIVFAGVATGAIGLLVCPDQREVGFVVIVMNITPVPFVVATVTLIKYLAHGGSLMRACLFMAAITVVWRFCVFLAGFMAGIATGFAVLPTQGEIRKLVIESKFVQFDNVRIPALVVRMAALAGLVSDLQLPAMKSIAMIDVLSDLLVTVKTERGLTFPVETIMTLGAFMFDLRMPLDKGTRHDQRLDGCRLARR